jgi:hypothetical protein
MNNPQVAMPFLSENPLTPTTSIPLENPNSTQAIRQNNEVPATPHLPDGDQNMNIDPADQLNRLHLADEIPDTRTPAEIIRDLQAEVRRLSIENKDLNNQKERARTALQEHKRKHGEKIDAKNRVHFKVLKMARQIRGLHETIGDLLAIIGDEGGGAAAALMSDGGGKEKKRKGESAKRVTEEAEEEGDEEMSGMGVKKRVKIAEEIGEERNKSL